MSQSSMEHSIATSETYSAGTHTDSNDNEHSIDVPAKTFNGSVSPTRNLALPENGCSTEENDSIENLNLHLTETESILIEDEKLMLTRNLLGPANGCSREENDSSESLKLHLTESIPMEDEKQITDSENLTT